MPPKWKEPIDVVPWPSRRSSGEVTQGVKVLRGVFGFLAIAVAIVAGVWTYNDLDSAWPAVFVGLLALQIVARAIPDLITDAKKFRRALYFAFGPALATGLYYLTYQLWETHWLSFVLGLFGGAILVAIIAPILFPAIHREEKTDSARRWGMGSSDT